MMIYIDDDDDDEILYNFFGGNCLSENWQKNSYNKKWN